MKNIKYLLIACFILAAALSGCKTASPEPVKPGDYEGSLSAGGLTRSYLAHVPPAYDGKTEMPMVIVLHGGGGNAQKMPGVTGMSAKADEAGFIAVYPNGTGPLNQEILLTWNADFCCGYALDNDIDDVGFIRSLIEKLEKELAIDASRIYVTGISNGGMMTYRLGCELADKIAAIAPVAGSMGDWEVNSESPVSVIIFHGTADQHVLYEGGAPIKKADTHDRIDKPVSYAVDFWAEHNGCSTTRVREITGNIVKDSYSGGKNGTEAVLYTIIGGGHAWPGGGIASEEENDKPTEEIYATDLMWEFFESHPKKQ